MTWTRIRLNKRETVLIAVAWAGLYVLHRALQMVDRVTTRGGGKPCDD